MTATASPNRSRNRASSRRSCSSPRAAVRASKSSSVTVTDPRPSFASKSRSSANAQRAAAARSDALYTMLSPVTNTGATVGQGSDRTVAPGSVGGGVADQFDGAAVPMELHVGVQALDPAGVGQRHGVARGLRRVNAIESVSIGDTLRDELAEVEQHRPGGGTDRVGVGLDDHRRQLRALVVVAG